jgi:hypothetical protein
MRRTSSSVMRMLRRNIQQAPIVAACATLSVFLLCPADSRASDTNQFYRLPIYATGGTPVKIVTADFNHDGKPDVVALNSNNVLSILLGTGNSAFAASKTITTLPKNTASIAARMVAGDFNGDGNQDVVVLPSGGNFVRVFLGHGDGTFAAPVSISAFLTAGDMVVGDFNGDNKADIALADGTSVSVLLGKSGGTLQTAIVTKTGLASPTFLALAVGDVNRDSHLDIVANDTYGGTQVLIGAGTGHFNLKPVFTFNQPAENMPTGIVVADFTGDGRLDVATGYGADYPLWQIGQACILPGYGDGTFNMNAGTCARTPYTFGDMLAGNLNGKQDLIIPSGPMMVQFNNGSGVMTPINYAVGGGPMVVGDFNGDSRQDIAAGAVGGVQVVVNSAPGVLRAPIAMYDLAGGGYNESMAMNSSDFNGDGYADLAVIDFFDEHSYYQPSGDVLLGGAKNLVFHGGHFGAAPYVQGSFSNSGPPAIGDFNHDGKLDIAVATTGNFATDDGNFTNSSLYVSFGDGKGNFPTYGPALDTSVSFIAAGDFNGDGKADLAALDGATFEILMGIGDGTFAPAVTYSVGANPVFVLQRDLNGDGKKDIVVVNQGSNDVSVLLGNGNGTFQPQKIYAAGTGPMGAAVGDFNRDGKIDIAVASTAGVSVLLGNGNGTFQTQKTYAATGPLTSLAVASVGGDGIGDIIGTNSATARFVLLPGVGNGTFNAPVFYPLDRGPSQMVAGDFNHDGATDLAFLGGGSTRDYGYRFPWFNDVGGLVIVYNQGGNLVTLASSISNPKANTSFTLTAHVTPSAGETGTATGSVTFKDGTVVLGTVSLSGGAASLSIKLAAGTHKIVASYAGDSNFNPGTSPTLTLVVSP